MLPVKFPRDGGHAKLHLRAFRLLSAVIAVAIWLPASAWSACHPNPFPQPAFQLQMSFDEAGSDSGLFLSKSRRGHSRGNLDNLSPAERDRMKQKYQEWQTLPPEEKEILRQRWEQWNRLSPREQELYRQRFRQWQQMSPEERRRIQQDLNRWDSLSPQERDAIRRRFRQ
jgi:Protein of unknown function (DUF3106)